MHAGRGRVTGNRRASLLTDEAAKETSSGERIMSDGMRRSGIRASVTSRDSPW